jgi:hypothetical protein
VHRTGYLDGIDAALEHAAREVLARAPRPPRDRNLFTSNTLFGEPGIYPDGSAMTPASGAPMAESAVRDELHQLGGHHVLTSFDEPRLSESVPDPTIRAALVALHGTVGEPVVNAFPTGTTAAQLVWGTPSSPGRVVGPAGEDPDVRTVNERYRAEHFALLSGSLVHDLLWTPETSGHAAEALLHALVAIVHLQLVARLPRLARLGSELARRQNSLVITLLNSREPGSARISLIAPDGPGTIPGGAPAMQTPDFWSIPFAPPRENAAPPLLAGVLDRLVASDVARPDPLQFDDRLAEWIDAHHDERWLPLADHVRVAVTLGLVDASDIAGVAGVDTSRVVEELADPRSGDSGASH